MRKKNHQSGFTLIELMIATVIFSIVLIIILASFLQVSRMFYKGISYAQTQESTRTAMESIVDDIRLSQNPPTGIINFGGNTKYFCVGHHRYTYTLLEKVTTGNLTNPLSGIHRTSIPGGCPSPSDNAGVDSEQLLGPDMQINKLELPSCNRNVCTISMHVIFYGVDEEVFASLDPALNTPALALNAPDAYCNGNLLSTQFCAVADLNTTVSIRN